MRVPSAVVDRRPTPFPAGTYIGRISEVGDRRSEDETWISLSMIFDEITPADDDTKEVGTRKYRARFTVVQNGVAVWDIEEFTDDTDFRLQQAAGLLSQLAVALGQAKILANKDVEIDMEDFCDGLLQGDFSGEEVMFSVGNRPYKGRDGTDRVDDGPTGFASPFTEEEEEEVEEAEDEDEGEEEEESEAPTRSLKSIRKR